MTADHDGHTGSIHIVSCNSQPEAETFARNEPYYLAGLYARIEIDQFKPWITESMWERGGDPTAGYSWLVIWRNENQIQVPQSPPVVPDSVLCGGWLRTSADGEITSETSSGTASGTTTGCAILADATATSIAAIIERIAAQLPSGWAAPTVIPWRRGGRLP
jgi:YCII-related domain